MGSSKKVFIYKAVAPDGLILEDRFFGTSEDLKKFVRRKGMFLLEYSPVPEFSGNYKLSYLIDDLQSLIFLLRSGIPIDEAIRTMIKSSSNLSGRNFWTEIFTYLKNGTSLSDSLERVLLDTKLSYLLPFLTFIRISEKKGDLLEGLEIFKEFIEERESLKKEIFSKLSYPMFLLISSYVVLLILFAFVIPSFYSIFQQGTAPFYLEIMFKLGILIKKNFLVFLLIPIFLTVLITRFPYAKKIFFTIPYLKGIVESLFLYNFFYIAYSGLRSGLKLDSILTFMEESNIFYNYRKVLQKLIRELKEGKSLAKSISEIPIFPSEVVPVISAAEESNNLVPAFESLYQRYREQAWERISKVVNLLEPITLVVVGSIVGLVVFSIISSILDMSEVINR